MSTATIRAWWTWLNSPMVIAFLTAAGLGWSLLAQAEIKSLNAADQEAKVRLAQLEGTIAGLRDGSWQDRLAQERRFGALDSKLTGIETKLERLLRQEGSR